MLNTRDDARGETLEFPREIIRILKEKFLSEYKDDRERIRATSVLDRMGEYRAHLEDVVDMFETTEFERTVARRIEDILEGHRLAWKIIAHRLRRINKISRTCFAGTTVGENHD